MRIFSTFSGIGGFELGINNASLEVDNYPIEYVGHSEINKYAEAVYKLHFGGKNYGDITEIEAEKLPDFDCLVGGFPCQAFSIAGKRKGFEDTRGTLFFDLARILRAKQPRLFVFENVKGLLNHDSGRTIEVIISTLTELGYDLQWQVVNSKDFGVAQNRERIIIVGNLRNTPRPEVFPIEGADRQDTITEKHTRDIIRVFDGPQCRRVYNPDGLSVTLSSQGGGTGAKTGLYRVPEATRKGYAEAGIGDSINLSQPNSKTRRGRVGKGIANTLDTGMHQYTVQAVLTPSREKKRQNGRRMKNPGEPSFTVTATDQNGIYDGTAIRRLTPLECERLQGFPDFWTKYGLPQYGTDQDLDKVEMSDTQRYRMCGNAVTTDVIQAVFSRILRLEEAKDERLDG